MGPPIPPPEINKIVKEPEKSFPKDRIVSFDFGTGFPFLIGAEAQTWIFHSVQVGFAYGLIPGLNPSFGFKEVEIRLDNNKTISVNATGSASIDSLSPFIRFYPSDKPGHSGFYLQYTHSLLRLKIDVPATVKVTAGIFDTTLSTTGTVQGSATFIQSLPTISIGNVWRSRLLFVNLSLGATFLWETYASANIGSGILPDAIGSADERQQAIDKIKTELNNNVNEQMKTVKKQIFLIPSIYLSFGFMF